MNNGLEPTGDLLVCLTKKLDKVTDDVFVTTVEEGGGTTSVAGTTGTTDTVNVIIDVGGKVIIDNMGDIGNIETTSGNGGGNQDGSVALTEGLESHFTFPLCSVTMNRCGRIVAGDEEVGENVSHPLGLDEHKSQATLGLHCKNVQEDRALIVVLDILDLLGDVFRGGANTADGEEDVVLEEVLGEDLDVTGEGGAEHEGLAVMDTRHILLLNDAADLMFETHVKHAVGFVKDEVTDVGKADTTTFDEINKTSGSGA